MASDGQYHIRIVNLIVKEVSVHHYTQFKSVAQTFMMAVQPIITTLCLHENTRVHTIEYNWLLLHLFV